MSAAPPPRFSTTGEDEESARNEASDAEGAKRTSQDLLSSLAARERSARERAAEAEVAVQRAADHRRAAEERLARYRDSRRAATPSSADAPTTPSASVQLEIPRPAPPTNAQTARDLDALDPQLLAQIDAAERTLARFVEQERELAEELAELDHQAEQSASRVGPAELRLEELRSLEQSARERLAAAQHEVGDASAQAADAQAAARREAEQARAAIERAEAADERLEEIVSERSSAFQRAIEHATQEQDASARASAARRTAQQAAAQRLAAEQSLDGAQHAQRLARLRAAIESSIDAASEGEGIEGEAAPPVQTSEAVQALEEAPSQVELRAVAELASDERVPEESAEGEPEAENAANWLAEEESSVGLSDLLAGESSTQENELRPPDSPWWLAGGGQDDLGWDESDESSRADDEDQRFLATLFSEDAFRGEAVSALDEEESESDESSDPYTERPAARAEPAARPPIQSLRARAESTTPRPESATPRRERAAAELARIERVASEQTDAVRKARQAEGQRVEAERDAYETAASQWRNRQRVSNPRGPGLYAEHDYAWEEQAAIGVQRKLAREDEVERRRRSAQAAAEQAAAARRAAEQLRAPSTAARDALLKTVIVSVAMGFTMIVLAWIVVFPRDPQEVAAPPAPPALASLNPTVALPSAEPEPGAPKANLQPPVSPVAPVATGELGRPAVGDVAATAAVSSLATAPSVPSAALRPPTPELRDEDWPAWRRYAVPVADPGGKPMIAIVIDDMGNNREVSAQIIDLPPPITVSFFPWVQRLGRQAEVARDAGHEIMAHVPMEPQARSQDPGPNYLGMSQSAQEIRERLRWNLDKFDFGVVGINNHMGSRFTSSGPGMGVVMAELLKRQMLFLDSRTTRESVGAQMAAEFGLPYAVNDLFLDNEVSSEGVLRRLDELELRARRKGSAIAIGHPHRETADALRAWIPRAQKRGFALVPLSTVVKHQMMRRAAAAAQAQQ